MPSLACVVELSGTNFNMVVWLKPLKHYLLEKVEYCSWENDTLYYIMYTVHLLVNYAESVLKSWPIAIITFIAQARPRLCTVQGQ